MAGVSRGLGRDIPGSERPYSMPNTPPAQNRYMQEKNLEELILARIHVGPSANTGNIFEELFLKYVFALWPCPLY